MFEHRGFIEEHKETVSNLGVIGYVEAKYLVAENVGIALTAKPQINVFNFYSVSDKIVGDPEPGIEKARGFAFGFAMPVSVGVAYSF